MRCACRPWVANTEAPAAAPISTTQASSAGRTFVSEMNERSITTAS